MHHVAAKVSDQIIEEYKSRYLWKGGTENLANGGNQAGEESWLGI
jgi:hypothetical protein